MSEFAVLAFAIATTATDIPTLRLYPMVIARNSSNTCRCLIPKIPAKRSFFYSTNKQIANQQAN